MGKLFENYLVLLERSVQGISGTLLLMEVAKLL